MQLYLDVVEILLLLLEGDIALVSDTVAGLQRKLNMLNDYCANNLLVVNIIKTKVMFFFKKKKKVLSYLEMSDGLLMVPVSNSQQFYLSWCLIFYETFI